MGLLLRGACPCSPHHPGKILPVEGRHLAFGRHRAVQPLLPQLQIALIILLIPIELALVNFQNHVGNLVEEVPVMRHHQKCSLICLQKFLQLLNHLGVQVVGRLIQNQNIGRGQHRRNQCCALLLPAG